MPHGAITTATEPIGGDAPKSNIVVPEGTLVIPLPRRAQPAMQDHEIITIVPKGWTSDWTEKIFAHRVSHVKDDAQSTASLSAAPSRTALSNG